MTKTLALLAALAVAVAVGVGSAGAITDGQPDGTGHPYVGLMVAQDSHGNPLWRCSGTLLSSRVYLTAGHCTRYLGGLGEPYYHNGRVLGQISDNTYANGSTADAALIALAPNGRGGYASHASSL